MNSKMRILTVLSHDIALTARSAWIDEWIPTIDRWDDTKCQGLSNEMNYIEKNNFVLH